MSEFILSHTLSSIWTNPNHTYPTAFLKPENGLWAKFTLSNLSNLGKLICEGAVPTSQLKNKHCDSDRVYAVHYFHTHILSVLSQM